MSLMLSDRVREIELELFESQNEIIRLQSECIEELFRLLAMHLEPEDLSTIPVIEKINKTAMFRAEHQL